MLVFVQAGRYSGSKLMGRPAPPTNPAREGLRDAETFRPKARQAASKEARGMGSKLYRPCGAFASARVCFPRRCTILAPLARQGGRWACGRN